MLLHRLYDDCNRVEGRAGHIPGATQIPLAELSGPIAELDSSRPIAVYCQSGSRSAVAASVLESHGFTSVWKLAPGCAVWSEAGLKVRTGA